MVRWLGLDEEAAQCAVRHQRRVGRTLDPIPRYGIRLSRLGIQEVEIVVTIGEVRIGALVRVREQKEGVVDAIRLEVLENLFRHINDN